MTQITGKAKKYNGTAIDYVQAFDWSDGYCIDVVTTDELGNWSVGIYGLIDVGFTYVANGCEPITHGPYSFDEPYDLNWSNVSLLMHFDGKIVDVSGNCSFEKLGNIGYKDGVFNKSLEFTPASSSSRNGLLESTKSNPALSLGAGDFTIELFINPSASYTQSDQVLINNTVFSGSPQKSWQILLRGLKPSFYAYDNGGTYPIISSTSLVASVWSHVAICRVNGQLSMYINGALVGSSADTNDYSSFNVNMSIGFQNSGSARYPFTGVLDEIRITKGIARYNGAFTPPTKPHDHGHS